MAFPALLLLGSACARDEAPSEGVRQLEQVAERHGIEIVTRPNLPHRLPAFVDGEDADVELPENAAVLASELGLYTPSQVEQAGLERVVLCRRLSVNGRLVGGTASPEHGSIYLNLSGRQGEWLRSSIHHELFHMIDDRIDRAHAGDQAGGAEWASLNPPGFNYLGPVADRFDSWSTQWTDKLAGFLNYYSTTRAEEDRAEVYQAIVLASTHLESRFETDPLLEAKARWIKARAAALCPDFDEAFWQRATGEWPDADRSSVVEGTLVYTPWRLPDALEMHCTLSEVLCAAALCSIVIYGPIFLGCAWKRRLPRVSDAVFGLSWFALVFALGIDLGGVVQLFFMS